MKFRWLLLTLFLGAGPWLAAQQEAVVVETFDRITNFGDQAGVRVHQADGINYSRPDWPDKTWLLTPLPFVWEKGIFPGWEGRVWVRLHLELTEAPPPGKVFGLELGKVDDVDRVWLNGELIGQTGELENQSSHAYLKKRLYSLPGWLLKSGDNVVAMEIRRMPGSGGGLVGGNLSFGPYASLAERFFFSESVFLLNAVFLSFLALVFFVFYFQYQEDKTSLIFATFLVLLAAYLSLNSDLKWQLPWYNFYVFHRLAAVLHVFLLPLFLTYLAVYFQEKPHRGHGIYWGAVSLLAMVFWIIPSEADFNFYRHWLILLFWIPAVYWILKILLAKFRQSLEARVVLGATVLVISTMLADYSLSRFAYFDLILTPWVVLCLVLLLTFVKVSRLIKLRKQSERFSKLLEERVEQRTAELEQLNARLEDRIQESVRQIREKDQMVIQQSRLASLGEIVGNIAHQWRQPLNALGLNIQDLKFAHEEKELDFVYLEKMVTQSQNLINFMSQTIDDFRQFFKPDSERRVFDPAEAVRKALTIAEGALKNARILVKTDLERGLGIYGYFNEFSQVILNMLLNSKDAILQHLVHNPWIEVTVSREGSRVVIVLEDNGGGIPDDLLEKVFDPYFTTKGQSQGTGLGLFMSKTIVEKHMGGTITTGNGSEGARFVIEFESPAKP